MHRGFEGDCRDIIPTLEDKYDLIVCDGPFGARMNVDNGTGEVEGLDWFKQCLDVLKPTGVICVFVPTHMLVTHHYQDMLVHKTLTHVLTWTHNGWNDLERNNDTTNPNKQYTNCILVFNPNTPKQMNEYIGHYPIEELKYHPHQKPVGVYQYLVNEYTNEADYILDPFAGSGILAKACKNRNYHAIDYSLEPYRRVRQDIISEGYPESID